MPTYNLKRGSVQDRFHASRNEIQVFGGGYGNGKTAALVFKGLRIASCYPKSTGLVARATYPKLNDTIRKEYLKWCPTHWIKKRPTQDDNTLYLTNGSAIHFRYVAQRGKQREDGSTTSNLLSATYDWLQVDQIEDPEIEYKDFLDLAGRLRGSARYRPPDGEEEDDSMPSIGPQWMMLSCNPARNWFYRKVIQPLHLYHNKGQKSEDLLVNKETGAVIIDLFEDSMYGNRHNLGERFIQRQEAMYKGQMRKRYIDGEWGAFEGLVHPDFEASRHLISREQAMKHLDNCLARHVRVRTLEGYDFGLVSPSCYLFSFIDDWGRVIVLDGYYKRDFNYTDQPAAIKEIRLRYVGKLYSKDSINADPDIFRRKPLAGHNQDTIAGIYSSYGVHMRAANNDVGPGIAKVNSYLAGLSYVPHLVTEEKPGPLIYFVDDLNFIQDEFGSYYWKKNPYGQHIDVPVDHDDHSMDTIKYMLSRLPEASKIVIPSMALPPQWKFWHVVEDAA